MVFIIISLFFYTATEDLSFLLLLVVVSLYFWVNNALTYYIFKKYVTTGIDGTQSLSRYDRFRLNYIGILSSLNAAEANQQATKVIRNQVGFRYHLYNYILCSLTLILISLTTGSPDFLEFWVILIWGLGVMFHYYSVILIKNHNLSQSIGAFFWLLYPGTLCIILLIIDIASGFYFSMFLSLSIPIMGLSFLIGGIVMLVNKSKSKKTKIESGIKVPSVPESSVPKNTSQVVMVETKPTKKMYCPSCGSEYAPDEKFCPLCATEVSQG